MRKIAYFVMLLLTIPVWLVTMVLAYVVAVSATWGKRIYPEGQNFGNCWTYSLPLWREKGGQLLIEIHQVGPLRIPHAIWVRPDGATQETFPINRATTAREAWFGLKTLYFRYRIIRRFKVVARARASKITEGGSL